MRNSGMARGAVALRVGGVIEILSGWWGTGVAAWTAAWRCVLVCLMAVVCGPVGCRAPSGPLARPVVIGASVSAGVQALPQRAGPTSAATATFAQAIDACIVETHGQTKLLADQAMVFDPNGSLRQQVAQARGLMPTVVFAVDGLFWSAYAPADSAAERSKRMEAALGLLESVPETVPLVVGDLPDMRGVVGAALGPQSLVSEAERGTLNQAIRRWADAHPRVVLLPLERLVEEARAGTSMDLGRMWLEGRDAGRLFASDGLHLTSDGQVALATLALSSLAQRGVIPLATVRGDLRESCLIAGQMAARERSTAASRPATSPVERERESLALVVESDNAVRAGDVDRAAELFAQRFAADRTDLRKNADVLDLELALRQLPALRAALVRRLPERTAAALEPNAGIPQIVAGIEFAAALGQGEAARGPAERLARVIATEQRHRGGTPQAESANAYALRLYDWFASKDRALIAALFTDASATATQLAEVRRSERAKLEFARKQGLAEVPLRIPTPAEELSRFAGILRDAGRAEEARTVDGIAAGLPP